MPPFLVAGDKIAYLLPDGADLFSNVTFSINPHQRIALVGPNGSGKSSLGRLIAKESAPSRGVLSVHGQVVLLAQDARPPTNERVVDFLSLGPTFDALARSDAGAASADDMALIGDDWDLEDRLRDNLHEVGLAHISPRHALADLSGGEWLRLQILVAKQTAPDLLILDEPSNHLDEEGRAWLEDWLGDAPFAWLLISHDRHLLGLAEEIWELTHTGLDIYGGDYAHYVSEKTVQDQAAAAHVAHARRAKRQAERDHQASRERQERRAAKGRRERAKGSQPKIILDGRKARSEQTGARLSHIKSARLSAAEDRVQTARARVKDRTPVYFDPAASAVPAHCPVLTIEGLCFGYGERVLFSDFNLALKGSQRVHLAGENGSGKSTLLDLIAAHKEPQDGRITRHVPIGYLLQREAHADHKTPVDRCLSYRPQWRESDMRTSLARAGLRREKAVTPVGHLSVGERLRADLVRLLNCPQPAQLLLLDEPSNHLDMDALEALEAALKSYRGCLLFTSHDPVFVDNMNVSDTVQLTRT